jgi:tetratricopeptide (TPR) repeat protein
MICAIGLVWIAIAAGEAAVPPYSTPIDRAYDRIYNFDFAGAHNILDAEVRIHPEDPLIYSVRATALLFSELDRLKILEMEFLESDEKITDKRRLKPDPAVHRRLLEVTAQARRLAQARLAADPNDINGLFSMCTAMSAELNYAALVEKRYFLSYKLTRESLKYVRKLLALNPPFYDAYAATGTVEYVVGNLNFIFRLFIRFEQIEGNKQKAIENLKKAANGGRYFQSFAKLLLAALYMRENQVGLALDLMRELEKKHPENALLKREIKRAQEKLDAAPKGSRY